MALSRYIVAKSALQILNIQAEDAVQALISDRVITTENLVYKNIPFASVMLTEKQRSFLKAQGIYVEREKTIKVTTLAADYEKTRTRWVKTQKRLETGAGVKVAFLDSGCNIIHVPVDFAYNFIDENTTITDGINHGTKTTSIVKSSIGLANGCILHHLKIIRDDGTTPASSPLAALDYCITNDIDVINMSFQITLGGLAEAVAACVSAGIVCVAAAGNNTTLSNTMEPAAFPDVIAVNVVKEDGTAHYKNSVAPPGGHGITVACSGFGCQLINVNGTLTAENGTSFAAPFFVGAFALYKERTGLADNYAVLEYMKKRILKSTNPDFGLGFITF